MTDFQPGIDRLDAALNAMRRTSDAVRAYGLPDDRYSEALAKAPPEVIRAAELADSDLRELESELIAEGRGYRDQWGRVYFH